jgi:hypothetical protein
MLKDSINNDVNVSYIKTTLQDEQITLEVVARHSFKLTRSKFTVDISLYNKDTPQEVIDAFIKLHHALQYNGLNGEITEPQLKLMGL